MASGSLFLKGSETGRTGVETEAGEEEQMVESQFGMG